MAVRGPLRAAIEGLTLSGDINPKLYVGVVPANAVIPYAYIWRQTESALVKTAEFYEATIGLEIYGRSSTEVQTMENAAEYLDDHNPAPFGCATSIRYFLASKTQLSEGEYREHSSILYRVTYADVRKLVGRQ